MVKIDSCRGGTGCYLYFCDNGKVIVLVNGTIVYSEQYKDMEIKIYKELIKARIPVLLQECGKLSDEYVMVEFGNVMYKMADLDYVGSHRKLMRMVEPIDYYADDSYKVDLLIGVGLYDYFTYAKGCLVVKHERVYLDGEEIKTNHSCEGDIIELIKHLRDSCGYEITSYSTEHSSGDL